MLLKTDESQGTGRSSVQNEHNENAADDNDFDETPVVEEYVFIESILMQANQKIDTRLWTQFVRQKNESVFSSVLTAKSTHRVETESQEQH